MNSNSGRATALLIMHMQPPLTDMAADPSFLDRTGETIKAARASGVDVIYVLAGYRPGYPELGATSPVREMLAQHNLFVDGVSNAVHEKVAPQKGDVTVRTPRTSAFVGTDLEIVLRSRGIDHLVLAGISTGGVVLATLTDAREKDFAVKVLGDACADPDAGVHENLLKLYGGSPWFSEVTTCDEWASSLLASV